MLTGLNVNFMNHLYTILVIEANGFDFLSIETVDGRSTLIIEEAQLTDSAWFQCNATNVAGQATNRAKLTVHPDISKMMEKQPEAPVKRVASPP